MPIGVSTRVYTAPPPPNPDPTKTTLYMPLYTDVISQSAIAANAQLVGFANLFTANPNSGPQSKEARPDVVTRLRSLRSDNSACMILGYVYTDYANTQEFNAPLASVYSNIDQWLEWTDLRASADDAPIKGIEGIMLDEYLGTTAGLPYYRSVRDYLRDAFLDIPSLGAVNRASDGTFFQGAAVTATIRGNPGAQLNDEQHLAEDCVDIISIHENEDPLPAVGAGGIATLEALTFYPTYPKSRFNWLTHSQPSSAWTDAQWNQVATYCGTVFITNQMGPQVDQNPWDAAPDSMARQIALIQAQP